MPKQTKKKKPGLPRDVDGYLERRYYDLRRPGSFASLEGLYRAIKNEGQFLIPREVLRRWLESRDDYVTHREARHTVKPMRHVVVSGVDSIWGTDLIDFNKPRYVKANRSYSYILLVVDVFSRYAWTRPLKNKSGKAVASAFEDIFRKEGRVPKALWSDSGREYLNADVRRVMEERRVHLYQSQSDHKSNYAERLIKTLRSKLFRQFQRQGTYNWIDHLDDVVWGYNHTVHSSVGRAPAAVDSGNEEEVFDHMYPFPGAYDRALRRARTGRGLPKKFGFRVGEHVNVSHLRGVFSRQYDQKFSNQIYVVSKRRYADQGIPVYELETLRNEPLVGTFTENQLGHVEFDPDAWEYPVEKVLRHRTRKGVKESLVRFLGWGPEWDEWVPDQRIRDLTDKDRSLTRLTHTRSDTVEETT